MNNQQERLISLLAESIVRISDQVKYNNMGVGIMNIHFDLAWEEVYGVYP